MFLSPFSKSAYKLILSFFSIWNGGIIMLGGEEGDLMYKRHTVCR